eukprot:3002965-Alexandrium_andersonii.AAC.1
MREDEVAHARTRGHRDTPAACGERNHQGANVGWLVCRHLNGYSRRQLLRRGDQPHLASQRLAVGVAN